MAQDWGAVAGAFFGVYFGFWFLVLLFGLMKNCNCFQIREREASVKEKCGRKGELLTPGWYCLCPFVSKRREYEYRYYHVNVSGSLQEVKNKTFIIPQQSQSIDYPAFEVITRDNVQCYLDLTITYSITNPIHMLYSVTNLPYMIEKLLNAMVRSRAGQLELDRIIEDPSQIARLQVPLQEEVQRWGVAIQMLKVQKVEADARLKDALALSNKTELENKVSIKKVSTDRQTSIIKAQAGRDAIIKEAEGKAQQMILQYKGTAEQIRNAARAEAEAIKQLASRGMGGEAVIFTLKMKYLDVLEKIIQQSNSVDLYAHNNDQVEIARYLGANITFPMK